jgi:hypothetical protein
MTWHKKVAVACHKCLLGYIPIWQQCLIIVILATAVWRVAAAEYHSAEVDRKLETHTITLARMEYAIGLLEKMDRKLDEHLQKGNP